MAYEVKTSKRDKFDKVYCEDYISIHTIPKNLSQEARSAYYANGALLYLDSSDHATVIVAPQPANYSADFVGSAFVDSYSVDLDTVLNVVATQLNIEISNVKVITVGDMVRATFDGTNKSPVITPTTTPVEDLEALMVLAKLINQMNNKAD